MDFAQRLINARNQRRYSLSDLARESGVSRGYLHQLEKGENNPTLDKLELIAQALGISVSILIGDATEETYGETAMLRAYRDGDLEKMMRLAMARVDTLDTAANE
jgi:transcriptional regulator with XRE-family HTH domain